jgi:hypothetical protein
MSQDLDELDRALSASLIRSRDTLSEDELQTILAKYRKQQESLIRKRMADRDRLTQKLQERLNEKKQQKKQQKMVSY